RRDRSSTYERYHHQNPQGRGVPGDHRHRYSSIDGDKRHREVRGHRRPGTSEGRGQPAAPPAGAADPACAAVDLARRAVRGPVARFLRRGRVPAPPPHPPTPGPARDRHDRERTRWVSPRCPPRHRRRVAIRACRRRRARRPFPGTGRHRAAPPPGGCRAAVGGGAVPRRRAPRRDRRALSPRGEVPPGAGDSVRASAGPRGARGRAGGAGAGGQCAPDAREPPDAVDDRPAPGRPPLRGHRGVRRRPRGPGGARPRTRSGAPRRTLDGARAAGGAARRHGAGRGPLGRAGRGRDPAGSGTARAPELTLRARRRLARVLAMKGRFDEALELFGQIEAQYRARSQEDDEATALGDLAAVVSVTGDLSRALRYLDEAEQLEERTTSTDAFLRLLRALLLTHSGRIEQAAEILREVPRPPDEPVPSSSEPAAQLAAMWWRVRSQ